MVFIDTPPLRFSARIYELYQLITQRTGADAVLLVLSPDPAQPGELLLTARARDKYTRKPLYPEWGAGDLEESLEDLAKELGIFPRGGKRDA